MALSPLARLAPFDEHEQEYLDANPEDLPEDHLAETVRQSRAIDVANRRAETSEPDSSTSTAPDESKSGIALTDHPDLDEFLAVAQKMNPGVPRSKLATFWNETYGHVDPTTLPTLEKFLPAAQEVNPDVPDAILKKYWKDNYGILGAREKAPGFGESFVEGLKGGVKSLQSSAAASFERLQDPASQWHQIGEDTSKAFEAEAAKHAAPEELTKQPWYQRLRNPEYLGKLLGDTAVQSAPSLGGAIVGGVAGGPVGAAAGMLAVTYFQQAGSTYREALDRYKKDGRSDTEAHAKAYRDSGIAGLVSGVVNSLAVPASLVAPFEKVVSNLVLQYALNIGVDTADQLTQNAIAQKTFAPETELSKGVPEAVVASGLLSSGETMAAVKSIATGPAKTSGLPPITPSVPPLANTAEHPAHAQPTIHPETIPAAIGVTDPSVSIDDAITIASEILKTPVEPGSAAGPTFEPGAVEPNALNQLIERGGALPTQADLLEATRTKRPYETPILPGPEPTEAPKIAPGQAFTPRGEPEPDYRAAITAERARLLDMRRTRTAPPTAQPTENAPVSETPVETPLRTSLEKAYPSVQDLHTLAASKGLDIEQPVFREYTKMVTGLEHLDDLTPSQRQTLQDALGRVKTANAVGTTDTQAVTKREARTPQQLAILGQSENPQIQDSRHTLPPEQNAEMLLRAEKAQADLEIAGKERGSKTLLETQGKGGTQDVVTQKSATADWYRTLTTGPSPMIKGDRTQSALQKIDEAIKKIIEDEGTDRGTAVEKVKAALLQDHEFRKTEWGRDLDAILKGEWPSWVPKPNGVDQAAHEAAPSPQNALPEPTQPQIEAGNYQKGHLNIAGMNISIENPAGSTRSGTDVNGKPWSIEMKSHYGYVRGTKGKDKEHIDVFVKPGTPEDYNGPVFVVDQKKVSNGHFDEHKIILGAASIEEARQLYLANYTKNWEGIRSIKAFTMDGFKSWLEHGDHQQPAGIAGPQPKYATLPPMATERGPGSPENAQQPPEPGRWITNTPAFKKWFKGSKVIDSNGKPLLVFHGGEATVNDFSRGAQRSQDVGVAFFTDDIDVARSYAETNQPPGVAKPFRSGAITKAYLSIKRPLTDESTWREVFSDDARSAFDYISGISDDYDKFTLQELLDDNNITEFWDYIETVKDFPGIYHNEITQPLADNPLLQAIGMFAGGPFYKDVIQKKYDGIIHADAENGGTTYIAFRSDQIQSLPNSSIPQPGGPIPTQPTQPSGEPFALTATEASKKPKPKAPEQLGFEVPPPTIGEQPIIGREATHAEAPLFSKAAQVPHDVQTSLPETAKEPWQMTAEDIRRTKPMHGNTEAWRELSRSLVAGTPLGTVHRRMISEALDAGKSVPPEVLADYPDLTGAKSEAGLKPEPNDLGGIYRDYVAMRDPRISAYPSPETLAKYAGWARRMLNGERIGPTPPEDFARFVRLRREGKRLGMDLRSAFAAFESGKDVTNTLDKEPELTPIFGDEPKPAPTTILANALRIAADQIEGKPKIEDVGEKIGGARKDLAEKTGTQPKSTAPKDTTPSWRKRYVASQILKSARPGEEGKWSLLDTKKTDFAGRPERAVRTLFDTKEEAEAAIPLAAVSRNHRTYKNKDGQYEIYRKIGDRKIVQVVEQTFPTEEAAQQYMVQHAEQIIETKTNFGEEILPRPETVTRTGEDRRNGKHVEANDFKDTFDFRAVEFGNWQNQEDRQAVMNHAYDGLLDLAEILHIPPKAIGLNGELALAFGARGHGLSGAAAHYEREYGVINLTKMEGAGHLAHEWFHATDHYFGRQDTKAKSTKIRNDRGDLVYDANAPSSDYVSHGFSRKESGVREPVRIAYDKLIQTMFTRAEQYTEDAAKVEKFVGEARKDVENKLTDIRDSGYSGLSKQLDEKYYKRNNKPATAEQLAEFDAISQQILSGEFPPMQFKYGEEKNKTKRYLASGRWTNDSLDKLSAIYKTVRGRSGWGSGDVRGVFEDLRSYMYRYSERLKLLADAQSGTEKTKQIPTEYAREAKSIDQGRVEAYWMTPHEMAARAFAAYVEDTLAAKGQHNDFIAYGTHSRVPTPWGWKQPYPAGEERKAINTAFDKLFDTMQSKETDHGTALFSKNVHPDPSPEEAQAVQNAIEGNSVVEAAQYVADHAPDPDYRLIASRVVDHLKEMEALGSVFTLHVAHQGDQVPAPLVRTRGMTAHLFDSPVTDIWVQGADMTGNVGTSHEIVLHELLHAVTQSAVHIGEQGIHGTTDLSKATLGLYRVMDAIQRHGQARLAQSRAGTVTLTEFEEALHGVKGANNALANVDELLAWSFTNREFQQYLEGISYNTDASLWDRFVAAIREFLGLPISAQTALSEVLNQSTKILNTSRPQLLSDATGYGIRLAYNAPSDRLINFAKNEAPSGSGRRDIPIDDGLSFDDLNNPNFKGVQTGTIEPAQARDHLGSATTAVRPYLLGALGLQQIADVYGRDHTEVARYNTASQQMEADFLEMSGQSDLLIKRWDTLKVAVADKMARVMEDARFAQFDADQTNNPLQPSTVDQKDVTARFNALPKDAQQLYRDVRDYYQDLSQHRFEAIKERIERSGGTAQNTKAAIDKLELAYEKTRGKVYFPFTRFGSHVVVAKKLQNGKEVDREVQTFDSPFQADQFANLMKARGWTIKRTTSSRYSQQQDGSASEAVKEMHQIINTLTFADDLPGLTSLREQLNDALNQTFLNSLPDMSYAKHFLHAKDVKGFSKDALRAFAHSALHGAHHISRIQNADHLARALSDLNTRIQQTEEGDVTEARQVYNEIVQRHEALLNPNTSPVAAWLGQLGFTMSLGGVVATGLTNATQVPLITLPWLGSRFGLVKSSTALARAYKDFLDPKTLNADSLFDASQSERLPTSERAMLKELQRRGRIDLTQTMDLAGRASQDNLTRVAKQVGTLRGRMAQLMGFTFHAPEVMNRQVTAMATYRLAKEQGASDAAATDKAEQAIIDTHFIYSQENRARYMSGNVLRVLTMFKQYSQNIAFLYGRAAYVWLSKNGGTPEEKTIARKQLLTMAALQYAAAGALGMPVFGTIADLLGAMMNAFGDDDEKKDWEVELRKILADAVGKPAGEVLAHGVSRLTPWDMAARLGQNDLFFREPKKEREGRAAAMDWLTSLAGPVLSYAVNAYLGIGDVVKGLAQADAGHFLRGVEELVPAVLRNSVKALRYELEGGVRTRDTYKQLDVNAAEKLGQFFGFTPSRAAEMYESTTAIKNQEHRLTIRRKDLLDHFAAASQSKDGEARTQALADIRTFNQRNPTMRISGDSLVRSQQGRLKHARGMEGGVYLDRKKTPLREQGSFANY